MNKRLVVIQMNLAPYHLARLAALAELCPTMLAIEISSKYEAYSWQIERQNLPFELKTLFDEPLDKIPVAVQKTSLSSCLSECDVGAVVVAGYAKQMRNIAAWAQKRNIPSILLLSTTEYDRKRLWWKDYIKAKFIMPMFSYVAASGQRSVQYAGKLKARKEDIFVIGNVVDNAHFLNGSRAILENESMERKHRNLPEQYFLTVSRLSVEKNYPTLLYAFRRFREQGGKWGLVIVGRGPMEAKLREITKEQNIPDVHFVGWQSYENLPAYYALASCFILASLSEPWGLVVNEAMACGLPVLVSRRCGSLPELCHIGVNGYDFDPCNAEEISQLMLRMSSGEIDLQSMGEASQRIISNFTPKTWAENLKNCVHNTMRRKGYGIL